jgi:hypothetical protein
MIAMAKATHDIDETAEETCAAASKLRGQMMPPAIRDVQWGVTDSVRTWSPRLEGPTFGAEYSGDGQAIVKLVWMKDLFVNAV